MTRTTMTTAPRTSASDMATASASAQVGPASGSARSRRPSLGPRFDAPCASGPASAVAAVGASAVWHGRCAHLDYPEHAIAVLDRVIWHWQERTSDGKLYIGGFGRKSIVEA